MHYKTKRTLNLLVLSEEPKSSVQLQLITKIKNNGGIDGFIFKMKETYLLKQIDYIKIYLKDVKNNINYIETITDGDCESYKMYDHIIILENSISSFYVDTDFKILKF